MTDYLKNWKKAVEKAYKDYLETQEGKSYPLRYFAKNIINYLITMGLGINTGSRTINFPTVDLDRLEHLVQRRNQEKARLKGLC